MSFLSSSFNINRPGYSRVTLSAKLSVKQSLQSAKETDRVCRSATCERQCGGYDSVI